MDVQSFSPLPVPAAAKGSAAAASVASGDGADASPFAALLSGQTEVAETAPVAKADAKSEKAVQRALDSADDRVEDTTDATAVVVEVAPASPAPTAPLTRVVDLAAQSFVAQQNVPLAEDGLVAAPPTEPVSADVPAVPVVKAEGLTPDLKSAAPLPAPQVPSVQTTVAAPTLVNASAAPVVQPEAAEAAVAAVEVTPAAPIASQVKASPVADETVPKKQSASVNTAASKAVPERATQAAPAVDAGPVTAEALEAAPVEAPVAAASPPVGFSQAQPQAPVLAKHATAAKAASKATDAPAAASDVQSTVEAVLTDNPTAEEKPAGEPGVTAEKAFTSATEDTSDIAAAKSSDAASAQAAVAPARAEPAEADAAPRAEDAGLASSDAVSAEPRAARDDGERGAESKQETRGANAASPAKADAPAAAAASPGGAAPAPAAAVSGDAIKSALGGTAAPLDTLVTPGQAGDAFHPSHPASQALRPAPHVQIGQQIAKRYGGGGMSFELRLDPPELGQVNIKLEVNSEGGVRASIAAETPAALADLMRNARELERALQSSGLDLEDRGLTFDLNERGAGQNPQDRDQPRGRSRLADTETSTPAAVPVSQAWRNARINVLA